MPAALKRPTLDELYKRLRDLDYTQVDERKALMLNDILQIEEQVECRESATEAVLMVGYMTEGISDQEQTRWFSWNVDAGVRGFDLARNPELSNNTEYGAGDFPLPARPPAGFAAQSTSRPSSMIRSQQTEEAYPDLSSLKRELERAQRENDKANLDRDGAKLDRDQANLKTDQAIFERDQAWRYLNMIRAEYQQEQRVRENEANCELVKRELEMILEREFLPITVPEFPMVRRITLGMNSPLVVPSLYTRAAIEKQQREFTDGCDHLFIGYSAAVYFHRCDIKINSWTTQAKKIRGSMPPIEKEDDSRQSLENHGKFDEIRRFYNKKFEKGHDVHLHLASTEDYSKPNKRGEYRYVSAVMGIAYNPFFDSEAGSAQRNHEVTELLKFWTEKKNRD